MRTAVAILLPLLFVVGCSNNSDHAELKNYLIDKLGIPHDQLPSAIFVVTEEGCPACQKAFADLVRPRTTCPQCLFLVRAEGSSIDLNGFLEETDRIRFDYDRTFKDLGLLKGSGVVLLQQDRIDTIIPLRVEEIKAQLINMNTILDSLCLNPPGKGQVGLEG